MIPIRHPDDRRVSQLKAEIKLAKKGVEDDEMALHEVNEEEVVRGHRGVDSTSLIDA